jgi:cell division septation protein DedD
MDEALLRRLLGAGTLLLLALVVSFLLPEPAPEGRGDGVVAYDLRTGREIGAIAPVEHPPELRPEERLEPRNAEPPAGKPAVPATLPRPALKVDETLDQEGGWFVQVGSYSSQANARNALQKLFGMGLPTVIQSVSVGKVLWYRVRVGPYPAEGEALAALARIRKNGYATARLVSPDSGAAPKGN